MIQDRVFEIYNGNIIKPRSFVPWMDVFQDTEPNVKDETERRKVIRNITEHNVSKAIMLS